tara:strand:+ start:366 stop:644 length:279 start_codon:yes stop_codon:yes gene_type:complete
MADTPQLQGAPITISQEDGSAKVYDTGLLSQEVQQSVDMITHIAKFRNILDTAGQVYSNIVRENLMDEAMVEEIAAPEEVVSEDSTVEEDTK